nr:PAS domain S-box protein [Deinobacterium chartae]
MPVIAWGAGNDGKLNFVNRAFLEYVGLEEIPQGFDLMSLVHPDDRARVTERAQHSLQTGADYEVEFRLRGTSGFRWFVSQARPRQDAQGQGAGWIGTCVSIHERVLAEAREQQLQEIAGALLRAPDAATIGATVLERSVPFLEAAAGVVALLSEDHGRLEVVASVGYPQILIDHYRVMDMHHPLPVTDALRSNTNLFLTGADLALQYPEQMRLRQQMGVSLQGIATLPLTFEGQALGVLTLAFAQDRDFSDTDRTFLTTLARLCAQGLERARRAQAEQAAQAELRRTAAQLDTLLSSAPVGLALFDEAGRFVRLNPKLAEINGLPLEAHLGRTVPELLPEMASEVHATILEVARSGRAVLGKTALGMTPAMPGVMRSWSVDYYPVRLDGGPVLGVGAIAEETTERERYQRALSESEARYRSLVQATSQIVWTTPPSGEMQPPQPTWSEFTGQSDTDMIGWGWLEAVHPEDRERSAQAWKRAVRERSIYRIEHRLRRKDGVYRHMQARAVPVLEEDGSIREWVGVHSDVTERREAQAQADRLARLVEESADLVGIADLEGRVTYLNAAGRELVGLSEEQYRQTVIEDFFLEEDRDFVSQQVLPTVLHEGRWRGDTQFRHFGGGKPIAVDWNVFLLSDPQSGQPLAFATVTRDIRERRRAEEALQQLNSALERRVRDRTFELEQLAAFNRLILEAAGEGIVGLDLNGQVSFANPAAAAMTGRMVSELVGENFHTLVRPVDEQGQPVPHTAFAAFDAFREGQVGRSDVERFTRPDGSLFPVNYISTPLLGAGGRVSGAVLLFSDITERKRSEERLRRANEELRRSNQELQQFAYVASHDLQEPLRTVASYTELLAQRYRGQLDERADRYIEFAVGGARRMQRLIHDLLAYSRAGSSEVTPEPTSSEEALLEVLASLEQLVSESGARVSFDKLPEVRADGGQLRQLFQNLIANGLKFRRPDITPHIHISSEREGRMWRFSVSDNGIGIDPRYFERIFMIFQRLHSRESYEGNGVGLAICKRIVERHGGNIWLESEPGKGSVFHFTLPAASR